MEMRAHFLGEDSIAGQQLNDLIQRYEKTTQEMEDTEMRIFEMLGKTGGDEGTGEGGDTSKPPKTKRLSLSDLMPEEDTKSPTSTPTSESIRKKLTGK